MSLQTQVMRGRRLKFSDAFGLVLQRHRAAKKLSKRALAEKAGLHQTYIGKTECGSRNPSLDAANAIAVAIGLPLSRLIVEAEGEWQRWRTLAGGGLGFGVRFSAQDRKKLRG